MLFNFVVLIFWADLLIVTYSNISEHSSNVLGASKPQHFSTEELASSEYSSIVYRALVDVEALLLLKPTAELERDVLPVWVSKNAILVLFADR